jgi:hypothetical protein
MKGLVIQLILHTVSRLYQHSISLVLTASAVLADGLRTAGAQSGATPSTLVELALYIYMFSM